MQEIETEGTKAAKQIEAKTNKKDDSLLDAATRVAWNKYDNGDLDNKVTLFWPIGPGKDYNRELRCCLMHIVNNNKDLVPISSGIRHVTWRTSSLENLE